MSNFFDDNDSSSSNNRNKGKGKRMKSGEFDLLSIDLRHPISATAKGLTWFYIVVPFLLVAVLGASGDDGIVATLAGAVRRSTIGTLNELQPVGDELYTDFYGESEPSRLVPGQLQLTNNDGRF